MKSLVIPKHPDPQPREVSLDEIYEVVDGCRRCPLCESHVPVEMGIGSDKARVFILMDTPANQDYARRASALEELLAAANLKLEDVYITSLVKCPPPPGRQILSYEVEECSAILREEIRSVWPDVIIAMGGLSVQFLLHTDVGVNSLEGRMYRRGHFQILPTYHIEQLMRDPVSMLKAQKTLEKLGDWLNNNPAQ